MFSSRLFTDVVSVFVTVCIVPMSTRGHDGAILMIFIVIRLAFVPVCVTPSLTTAKPSPLALFT